MHIVYVVENSLDTFRSPRPECAMTSEHLDSQAFPSLGANRHKSPSVRTDGSPQRGLDYSRMVPESGGCSSVLQQLRMCLLSRERHFDMKGARNRKVIQYHTYVSVCPFDSLQQSHNLPANVRPYVDPLD